MKLNSHLYESFAYSLAWKLNLMLFDADPLVLADRLRLPIRGEIGRKIVARQGNCKRFTTFSSAEKC